MDDPAEDVAADVVGAEEVLAARRGQADLGVCLQGIVGGEDVGEDRREDEKQDQGGGGGAQRLSPEDDPE